MFYLLFSIGLAIISYIVCKQYTKSVKRHSNAPKYDHAIIMGGSVAGMVTSAYLTKYFKRITIIESDDVLSDPFMKAKPSEILDYRCHLASPTSIGRSGVGQIYQLHVIEAEGHKILCELFPHLQDKLLHEYNARMYSLKTESMSSINGVLLNQNMTEDIQWLGLDRFTLETVLRRELCSQFGGQIEWICNTRVTKLIVDRSLNMIKGIKYRSKQHVSSSSLDMYGDFIVDCTGRNTSATKWLQESLDLIIPRTQIHFGCGYVTFIGERFKTGDSVLDSKPIILCTANPPERNMGCYVTPIRSLKTTDENSLGTLTSIGFHCVNEEYPPNDSYDNLLAWVEESLDPLYYNVLKSTKPCGPLVPYRRMIDDRKHVELLGNKWPQNFILLGDSMCTFNPQYGQGMTHACRQARELNSVFDENHHQLNRIPYIFNRRASAISEECWLVSTANDWKTPKLKLIITDRNGDTKTYERDSNSPTANHIPPQLPLIIRFLQWYNSWFLKCASKSGPLSTDFLRVINQHNSPFILMKPKTILTLCWFFWMKYFKLSSN